MKPPSKNVATRLFSLEGRTALVTGACGQLGRAFAETLARAGAKVLLTDVATEACEKLAREASKAWGRPVQWLYMDVTSRDSIASAFEEARRRMGQIDILVNNAGIGIFTPFEKRTEQEVEQATQINLHGPLWCSQLFAEQAHKGASIVNIGSIYGVVAADPRIYGSSGRNSSEIYAATKAGVIHMTRYLAVYLAPRGIRVNCISPGGVFNHQDKSFIKNYEAKTPLRRMAKTDDLQGALLYLASDASAYMTGQNLIIDGGFGLW
jgi:NAD(P)-dependent dehydrogenase (short-subunit alcohol dehydrogenase family)